MDQSLEMSKTRSNSSLIDENDGHCDASTKICQRTRRFYFDEQLKEIEYSHRLIHDWKTLHIFSD